MRLKDIAHSRTGDKGNLINISIIPYDEKDYDRIGRLLTEEKVDQVFEEFGSSSVTRYDLEELKAYNFVLEDVLEGGVSVNNAIDKHGKSLGAALLEIRV